MKRIKLKFIDTPPGVDLSKHYFCERLRHNFAIELCDAPDYIISLGYGYAYLDNKYDDCIKIYITAENDVPNFSLFDYALGHAPLSFGDRYLRHPIYAHWKGFSDLSSRRQLANVRTLLNRDFCSIVVSNNASSDPIRKLFFQKLSNYRPVASGGRMWNNIGGPCSDKLTFISKYKFNIAFENSSALGYTTEKVMEAFAANTVPIYFGNPLIYNDFNPNAMIVVTDISDIDRAIAEVIHLDKDDSAYLQKCQAECFPANNTCDKYNNEYDAFMKNIFQQDKKHARRIAQFGREPSLRKELQRFYASYDHDFLRKAKNIITRIIHRH